jgi:hypothetical protein
MESENCVYHDILICNIACGCIIRTARERKNPLKKVRFLWRYWIDNR